jgi:lysophospholipase L1-like esterase
LENSNERTIGTPLVLLERGNNRHGGNGIDPALDCVTIFAGTNDYRLNKPLGKWLDKDMYTFIGAYSILIQNILTSNPSCRLNLWTPLMRDKDGFDIDTKNGQGYRLADYVDAVSALGRRYALPVLDLYAESGLNKLTLPIFTSDGLHPNERGFARIAAMAVPFLERI